MWQNWVTKFMSVINKHAPLKKKRLGKKKSPWITPEVISKMRQRDSLKKKFDITKHEHIWSQYKKVRNETNNLIKQSKRSYFISKGKSTKFGTDIDKYVLNNIEYGPHQDLSKIRRKCHLRYDVIQYQHGNEVLAKMPQIHATFYNALLKNYCLVHETSK